MLPLLFERGRVERVGLTVDAARERFFVGGALWGGYGCPHHCHGFGMDGYGLPHSLVVDVSVALVRYAVCCDHVFGERVTGCESVWGGLLLLQGG